MTKYLFIVWLQESLKTPRVSPHNKPRVLKYSTCRLLCKFSFSSLTRSPSLSVRLSSSSYCLPVFYVSVYILQAQKQQHPVRVSRQRRRQRNAAWRKRNRVAVFCTTQRCSVCSASPTQWQKIVSADPLFRYIRASMFLYSQALVTTWEQQQRFLHLFCVKRTKQLFNYNIFVYSFPCTKLKLA